jgi:hypothetical protein
MLVPFTHMPDSFELPEEALERKPRTHHASIPFREGEFVITRDDPSAPDWYVAEISRILPDRIEVNYYTTATPPLEQHLSRSQALRMKRLGESSFLRTWCLEANGFLPTTEPPLQATRLNKDVYKGSIPLREIHQHILLRDVKLTALGLLDPRSMRLACTLNIPHHVGAGGEDDFA